MAIIARLLLVALLAVTATGAAPQDGAPAAPEAAPAADPRAATGGAQTLEDILARQRGERIDDSFRREATGDADSAAGMANQLGTLGGASDAEVYRALRYGTADIVVSAGGPEARVVMQDRGMWWLAVRSGPLATYGGYLLLGTLAALVLFYLLRGKIRIEAGFSGETILRFTSIERFAHWLLAGSFILLGLTGLMTLFGREALVLLFAPPADGGAGVLVGGAERFGLGLLGPDGYDRIKPSLAFILNTGKWVHNNVAWAFMLALVLVFLLWVAHNIPNRHDLIWMSKAGGLLSKHSHPPARKFNAGQKIIFWAVILLGGSISASGLSLLFPFEMAMFAPTFAKLNDFGVPAMLGMAPFPTELAPHEEMQYAQLWHAVVSFLLMAIIVAHMYLGSVGMEGAYDAMGSGHVDKNWAREHHSLWVEEVEGAGAGPAKPEGATPAE